MSYIPFDKASDMIRGMYESMDMRGVDIEADMLDLEDDFDDGTDALFVNENDLAAKMMEIAARFF
jgi:hypothetical protein